MNDVTALESQTVDGGAKCDGVWLGTFDGLYGVCIGRWT
jgi:hypothetical protein